MFSGSGNGRGCSVVGGCGDDDSDGSNISGGSSSHVGGSSGGHIVGGSGSCVLL